MKKGLIILLVVLVVLVGGGISWYVSGVNRVVRLDEEVNESWAQIDTQLKRRLDLIPNLVRTVKGYAAHEKKIFIDVAEARAKLAGATTIAGKIEGARGLGGALGRLLAIAERYPDLRASENFQKLQDELAGTENRISVARVRYNRAVKAFNAYRREFFGRFFAKRRGLTEPRVYFEVEEEAKEVPKVEF